MKSVRTCLTALMFAVVIAGVSGCKKGETGPPPGPAVTVAKPLLRQVTDEDVYAGRLESPNTVRLAARVSGVLESAPFSEGSLVHEGDTLFILDARPFKAELASREADVAKAEALLAQAQVHYKRYSAIRQSKAISAEDYDQSVAALHQAQAQFEGTKAARDVAQLNLEWTRITAPITGRVSRKLVTEGNLISGGNSQATILTTITSIDPLYCYVNAPESAYIRYRQLLASQTTENATGKTLPCAVSVENETDFTHQGVVDFIDSQIDPATGTVQLRGVIQNKSGDLAPGLFARLKVPAGKPYQALLIPDAAIGTDQASKFVLVVAGDNTVVHHSVTLGSLFGSLRAVVSGLQPDERVIINGIQKARPGSTVTPTEVPILDPANSAAAPVASPTSSPSPGIKQ